MKSNNKSNNRNMPKILFPLIFLIVLLPLSFAEGVLNDYCVTPPFLSQSIPPNVLIVLDNSGSMCDQAYAGSYDPTQFASGYYYGYFDPTKNYKYSINNRWEETTDAMTTGTTSNPIANGSFLNWATMRRVEVAKKLLTGGKGNPRSPSPGVTVKLDGETGCGSSWDFQKDHDTSAGNLIYPFVVGNYRFTRSSDDLNISPLVAGTNTENRYPTSDVANGAWTPNSGTTRWDKVDEVSYDDDTTYIQNTTSSTNDQVILGYDKSAFSISGTITNVTVVVRAKKAGTSTSAIRKIRGVLRMKDALVDVDWTSNASNLSSTRYLDYNFNWATNPQTGAAWQWADLTSSAVGSLTGFGVKADTTPSATNYPRVTQIYIIVTVSNPSGGPYNTIVDKGSVNATGIIDTLSSDVRFGLAYYNTSEGAYVKTYVDFGATTSMQTSIDGMIPSTWTPLGETLYEMTRYFRQDNPYYGNTPADYQKGSVQIGYDPYWYKYSTLDAGLADQYVPCARSFVLFLTDGESTMDESLQGSGSGACSLTNIKGCSSGYRFAGTAVGTTYPSSGTDYLIDVAFWARTADARSGVCTDVPTTWQQCIPGTQNVTLYSVYMFGRGSTLLKDAAIDGGFDDMNGNNAPDCNTIASECYRDTDGDGIVESNGQDDPLTYYEGDDGYALETSITDAINAILKRASSGTAASVLASGEGSGANLVQAIFYPKRTFDTTEIDWTATLQNLWYYIDPFLENSSIRENTVEDTASVKDLKIDEDYIVNFFFDEADQRTKANRYESDAEGNKGAQQATVLIEELEYLWEAGSMLHSRNIGTDPRTIYTTTNGTSLLTGNFTTGNASALQTILQASSLADAQNIISYVRGDSDVDTSLYRSRTVTNAGTTAIWRLGDIVSSTPRVVSWINLNNFYKTYKDSKYNDFLNSDAYKYRGKVISGTTYGSGMVFTGANDGMLHAFKLGALEVVNDSTTKKASLKGTDLGKEEWAFIPKNSLPYLKYLMDKNYCHLYYVDATPFIFDASIGSPSVTGNYWNETKTVDSWRTILIGGMRLGGACKAVASTYGVQTPIAGEGYSSYFAMDITDPTNPILLWEFSRPAGNDLGFTTTGPALIKINARDTSAGSSFPNKDKNGRWFVVFASGPTGPIDTTKHQFKGYSDQNLKLFVLDLKTGALLRTIDTGIENAFGGSLNNANIDYDLDYQDDAIYLGYTKAETNPPDANTKWTNGGIIRLITREDLNGGDVSATGSTALNPANWTWSYVTTNIGSATSSVGHLAHYPTSSSTPDKAWLYFGTGRYFYKEDDITTARVLFGVKEKCLSKIKNIQTLTDPVCDNSDVLGLSDLDNATTTAPTTESTNGWYITLDSSERVITDPLASTTGAIFFTTFAPSSDICEYGGSSYLWAVKYDTGGSIASSLRGKALLQVSTGVIEEIVLKSAFTQKGGRRTASMQGVPPTGAGLSIVSQPPPVKRVIHMRER